MRVCLYAVETGGEPSDEFLSGLFDYLPGKYRRSPDGAYSSVPRGTVWAYALLRHALTAALGIGAPPSFEYGEHGKPFIRNLPGIHFSISHTKDCALCAMHDAPIGADIERIRPVRPGTARRIMADSEYEDYLSRGNETRFFDLWVLKESYIKFTGEGFSIPPNKLEFDLSRPGEIGFCRPGCSFRLYEDLPGCRAAVCSPSRELPGRIEILDPKTLARI